MLTLLLLAVVPSMVIMGYIYFKDVIEKEPIKLIAKNFILGATVSVLITAILSFFADSVFPLTNARSVSQQFFKAFFSVSLVEEFSKYIIVLLVAQKLKEFRDPFDGIVYAVAVSLGFATLENVLYVFQYGFETGVVRAFTAVPAHAVFGVLMGYFMGKAKFAKNKVMLNLTGLLLAFIFHGFYDFFLFISFIPGISSGAFVSLFIGVLLSRKAIEMHQ